MRDRRTIRAALLLLPAAMLCGVPLFAQEVPADPASPEPPGDRPAVEAENVPKHFIARLQIDSPRQIIDPQRYIDSPGFHKVAAEAGYRFEIISWSAGSDFGGLGEVALVPIRDDADPNYHAVFEQIANRLQNHLTTINREKSETRLDEARHRAEEAENAIRELQAKLRKQRLDLAARGVMPRGLEEQTARLHEMRLTLQVDLAGMRARREEILKHLEAQTDRLLEAQHRRAAVRIRFLEKSLEVSEADYRRLLEANTKTPGVVPASHIEQAKLRVEETKSQIDSLRESPQNEGPGGELLVGLTRQLMDVEIELAGAGARLEILDDFFKTITSQETRTLVDLFESLEREVHRAEQRHEAARDELVKIERQNAELRLPEVRIEEPREIKEMEKPEGRGGRPWWER
ncbi:MAG TPA: hypothetical protein DD670_15425 [Planctomycetaceae bacterium]|nr:hypothetical protein [Planctomycetaceae bacterium]